ncbi:LOW QUALITY PROTEIN: SH3 domain-containing kinase-binding protein 1 [Drosophila obscura]|uniref:LOW QUALITY PROTEIN: SH3 domain-containing kinase-binding protein 1 n=1 Tax=Drosophila obscura TaxID=7282 RepID=UPI001BB2B04C|nr:LOW QUALITY PROTEIN: SH3 domain-containing kinase-binding protein 1 [Drosophila obscura]
MDNIRAVVEYEYAAKEQDELDLRKGAIIHHIQQMPGGWWMGTLKATGKTGMFPDNFVRVLDTNGSTNGNGEHIDDGTAVQLRDKSETSNRRVKVVYSYTQVNDDELTLTMGDVIEFLGEVEEGWWRGRLRSKVGVFPSNFVRLIEPSPILASKRPPTIGATVTTSSLTAKAANVAETTAAAAAAAAPTTKQTTKSRGTASSAAASAAAPATVPAPVAAPITVAPPAAAAPAVAEPAPMLPPKPSRLCRVEFPYAPMNEDELELKVDEIITVISMELPDKGWWKGEIHGKVGVFPDNFVKMLEAAPSMPPPPPPRPRARPRAGTGAEAYSAYRAPPRTQRGGSFEFLGARMASFITTIFAPINEPATTQPPPQQQQQQQSQKKISNSIANATSHMTTTNSSNSSSSTTTVSSSQQREQVREQTTNSTTSKVYIKKTGSSSQSSSSSGRKESFGSRDSLNDILSETGLPSGNVAAQRKSLETKNLDLSKQPGQQKSAPTTTALSKSMESLDEKVKSPPPPVLSKKPSVPLKKTPTGGVPVAGNLLGGKKKSNPEGKLTSAVSHDLADGLAASKLIAGHLPEQGVAGNLVIRRAATIAGEDVEFDLVERASILPDVRAGRVKAPKRRPPSAAINVLGESNNNSVYVNGSGMAGTGGSASELSEDGGRQAASSDDNSTGEEQLAKPKPREWEKKKAPWMEELKASQVTRKKTSPSVEPRGASVAERTSKLFAAEQVAATASVVSSSATSSSNGSQQSSSTTTKVQSSAVTSSSILQQSMIVESSSRKESSAITSSSISSVATSTDAAMSRSLSAAKAAASDEETRAPRPNSLSIRNRSVSPLVKTANVAQVQSQTQEAKTATSSSSGITNTVQQTNSSPAPAQQLSNHQESASASAAGPRVAQLEQRVDKLEAMVQTQQRTIEELVRSLREETDRVKLLRSELDKYAQCVTQV